MHSIRVFYSNKNLLGRNDKYACGNFFDTMGFFNIKCKVFDSTTIACRERQLARPSRVSTSSAAAAAAVVVGNKKD